MLWLSILVLALFPPIVLLSWLIGMLRVCRELQYSVLEEDGLSLAFDVEADFDSVGIHDSSSGVQERSSQYDGRLLITICLYYYKVCRNIRAAHSYTYVF
jgi:hypothetical protein